jgi:hypothetical protein
MRAIAISNAVPKRDPKRSMNCVVSQMKTINLVKPVKPQLAIDPLESMCHRVSGRALRRNEDGDAGA